ncbi:MAG: hypothetical protein KKA73_05410 [Chloroflexi bacterium]|nr:hypothetical protein [Chloroflexota bacterium]MBU1747105.1 hypothetical protein [Chloroflexota bacterium]
MRILSVRRGFDADHSSSSYEFFAFQKLTPEQRAAVQQLTDESPRRHLSFHYVGDWQDIPSDWPDQLLASGYDVMVSESYDWWTVRLALPHDPDLQARLEPYQCESDGNGFAVDAVGERLLLYFGMQLDYNAAYSEFGEDAFEGLADLFKDVRDELLAGDLSAAWATYQTYGEYDDEESEPAAPLSASAKTLLNVMENY